MKYTVLLICTLLLMVGCSRYPSAESLPEALTTDSKRIIEEGRIGEISLVALPDSISSLDPESIQLREEGLYIKLWSSFVEEGGLFIPSIGHQAYDRGTDPSYWPAQSGIYFYLIKG